MVLYGSSEIGQHAIAGLCLLTVRFELSEHYGTNNCPELMETDEEPELMKTVSFNGWNWEP